MEKKKNKALSIVGAIIYAIALICCLITMFNTRYALQGIAYMVITVLVGLYAVEFYKTPHGNALRWLMLAFAACLLPEVWFHGMIKQDGVALMAYVLIIGAVCYGSGRLMRIKSNMVIFTVVLLFLAGLAISSFIRLAGAKQMVNALRPLTAFLLFLILTGAYAARYREHKEAGLKG